MLGDAAPQMGWHGAFEQKVHAVVVLGQVSWEGANEIWSMGGRSNEAGMAMSGFYGNIRCLL